MGHNSFIKGSITHVSLGFSHYFLVQLHLVARGKTSVPGGGALGSNQHRWSYAPSSRPLWPNDRPSECGASTLWINNIPTHTDTHTKKRPIKQRRSELELGVTLEQINLEADGPETTMFFQRHPHTHPCILSLRGLF